MGKVQCEEFIVATWMGRRVTEKGRPSTSGRYDPDAHNNGGKGRAEGRIIQVRLCCFSCLGPLGSLCDMTRSYQIAGTL